MYLDVQPLAAAPVPGAAGRWGWDVRLRDHRGTQLCDASAGFGTVHEATDLARFASVMLAERDPLDFHLDGSEPGWRVTASGPGGQRVAQSKPMSEFGAHHALRFIEDAATRSGERTLPLRVNSTCLCGPDDGCRHHTMPPVAYTGPDMPSEPDHYLTVAPDSDDAAWWQVVAREAWDDHPRVRSLQLPSRSDTESLAMFVSAVAAEPRSVVYDPPDGPKPSFRTDDHQDSVLVDVRQVLDGEGSVAGWQLRATTPDGSFAGPDGPTLPSLTAAHEALDFVKAAVSCFPAAWPPRPPMPRVEVHTACACGIEGWECRHYSNPPELAADPPPPDPARAVMVGIHVRPYSDDSRGWEVVTTDRDGSPWQLSGPYQTVEDATAARDFMARVVNAHPQLHVLGSGRRVATTPTHSRQGTRRRQWGSSLPRRMAPGISNADTRTAPWTLLRPRTGRTGQPTRPCTRSVRSTPPQPTACSATGPVSKRPPITASARCRGGGASTSKISGRWKPPPLIEEASASDNSPWPQPATSALDAWSARWPSRVSAPLGECHSRLRRCRSNVGTGPGRNLPTPREQRSVGSGPPPFRGRRLSRGRRRGGSVEVGVDVSEVGVSAAVEAGASGVRVMRGNDSGARPAAHRPPPASQWRQPASHQELS